ncbi:MAG: transposase [Verrucomicrobiales bacterium]|nr:transposase [Verrucomicrobiales bacterium]
MTRPTRKTPEAQEANTPIRQQSGMTARLMACLLQSEHPKLLPWRPLRANTEKVKELSRYADAITQDTARLKTKLEAATQPAVQRSLKRRIKAREKELLDIRKRIEVIIAGDDELSSKYDLLLSIPGLGEITCRILIAELPEIESFGDARQLAARAGVTPGHDISGNSGKTQTPITKVGSTHLRRALYLPAIPEALQPAPEELRESPQK